MKKSYMIKYILIYFIFWYINTFHWIEIYFDWIKIYSDIYKYILLNRNSFWLNKNVCHINIFHWIEIYFDWIQICIDITKKFPLQHFSNHTCHTFKIEDFVKTFNSLNPSKCFTESSICFLELIDYTWLKFSM